MLQIAYVHAVGRKLAGLAVDGDVELAVLDAGNGRNRFQPFARDTFGYQFAIVYGENRATGYAYPFEVAGRFDQPFGITGIYIYAVQRRVAQASLIFARAVDDGRTVADKLGIETRASVVGDGGQLAGGEVEFS